MARRAEDGVNECGGQVQHCSYVRGQATGCVSGEVRWALEAKDEEVRGLPGAAERLRMPWRRTGMCLH